MSKQQLWIISFLIAVIQPCSGMNRTGNLCARSVMIKKQEMKKEHQPTTTDEAGAGVKSLKGFCLLTVAPSRVKNREIVRGGVWLAGNNTAKCTARAEKMR
jgi:hypothetical protein